MKRIAKLLSIVLIATMVPATSAFADNGNHSLFDNDSLPVETKQPEEYTEPVQSDQPQSRTTTSGNTGGKRVVMVLGNKNATVNGQEVILPFPPQSIGGRTYLPLRFLSEQILGTAPSFHSDTGQITVDTGTMSATVTLNKKEAVLNGQEVQMPEPPIVRENTTLLPLKFFVDNFGLNVSYDPQKKEVVVTEELQGGTPPVADFEFVQSEYIQGQNIEIIDKSTFFDGDRMIAKEFALSDAPTATFNDVNKLVENLQAGTYEVLYRVQGRRKVWSEWVTKPLLLQRNQPPTITDVHVDNTDIGRGEGFGITYTQVNEPWERITDEIWTYRHENQDVSKAAKAKPEKLFSPGKYFITLQLKDAFGNVSEPYEIEVQVGTRIVQTQLQYFANSEGVINTPLENFNGTNYLELFKELDTLRFEDKPGLLIMSDSPENVYDYGILYEETVTPQRGRLLTYHVNKIPEPKSNGAGVVVIVQNMDVSPVSFHLEQTGMKGPSTDPHEVGGKVLETHFSATSQWETTMIDVGASAIVYDSRQHLKWKQNNLISMLSEFETSGAVKIIVAAFGPSTQVEHLPLLAYQPRDQHPRGTFNVIERATFVNVPGAQASSILLGKNSEEWVRGIDSITNEITENRGNYGIEYKITVTPQEDTLLFVNCRGGAFRGFIGWPDGINRTVSSYGPHDARYLGKIPGGESTTIRYMLANGSASPVKIGFMPRSLWDR
ncbi:copper amine oxidase N-terminal domain-containing protein [Filifactor villosus]|uniref:Copper amine oxidase N-terminal domain-containing protein n=1 Tax=Filifactor villosus TaxID=29374 RepID=A0ABV9QPW4_9FIRM